MTTHELLKYYGSELKAAAEIGVSITSIRLWVKKDDIPYLKQLAIQTLTKNKLRATK